MSAEIAGFDERDHNVAFEAASLAATVMYETGVSEGRAWGDGISGAQYGVKIALSALRRINALNEFSEEDYLQALSAIEHETLPGKRREEE